jgi:radical SAM/Cys-rich protein
MTDTQAVTLFTGTSEAETVQLEPGPRAARTLRARSAPLASSQRQIATLDSADLSGIDFKGDFDLALSQASNEELHTEEIEVFQINMGRLCNMVCRHCHVDAGPDRWDQVMSRETVAACLQALDRTQAVTVDLTGGAPELNPSFRYLVEECVSRGKQVIDRCNLTVLLLQQNRDLPEWLANHGVEMVCSLPHFRSRSTDAQRGRGTFERSIEALRRLNQVGYGCGDPNYCLTLMVNPAGAFLNGNQSSMEREWRRSLESDYQVTFDRLIALNNMPIARYLEWLETSNNLERYLELLVNAFNPATIAGLMCRNTISVSWDGRIFDCDFNQMLDLESRTSNDQTMHVSSFDPKLLAGRRVVTGRHCFGCTAGAGSSCGGATDSRCPI